MSTPYRDVSLSEAMQIALRGAPAVADPHGASTSTVHFVRQLARELTTSVDDPVMPHVQFALDRGWVTQVSLPGGVSTPYYMITDAGRRFADLCGGTMPPITTTASRRRAAAHRRLEAQPSKTRVSRTAARRAPRDGFDGREAA